MDYLQIIQEFRTRSLRPSPFIAETGEAVIEMEFPDGFAEITFRDWGTPYNPLARPDPDVTLPAEERQIGGLGIYMVKKSMDAVSYRYEDGQNILTVRRKL